MQENYISGTKVVALTLWGVAIGLLVAAWVLIIIDWDSRATAIMLAATGSITASAAAVAQVRMYALRMSHLIRVMAGLKPEPDSNGHNGAEVRNIR